MHFLKRLLDFYLQGSLHVALSVYALVAVTALRLSINVSDAVLGFAFFGTVVGYNFVKYDALARGGKPNFDFQLKAIIALSFLSFLACGYCFLKLERQTQLLAIPVVLVTMLYTLPFFPNRKTARDWAGLKIYFVALCWVGVTVVLPVVNAAVPLDLDFALTCVQRFIIVVVLLFIFEIIDLAWDDPHLKTVPQQIGIHRTKMLGLALLAIFLLLDVLRMHPVRSVFWGNIFFGLLVAFFLLFANEKRGKYYTLFWAESTTLFWWLALVVLA